MLPRGYRSYGIIITATRHVEVTVRLERKDTAYLDDMKRWNDVE